MKHLFILLFLMISSFAFAQQTILIQLESNVSLEDFNKSESFDLQFQRTLFPAINLYEFSSNAKLSLASLSEHSMIKSLQFNQEIEQRFTTPDDPEFGQQWALERINAQNAWDVTTGGTTVNGDEIVVAILETGFDIEHEDLVDNIWQNPYEIPNNEIDDDQNGFVDDVHGWNFRGNNSLDPNHAESVATSGRNEFDTNPHGQQVTGIVGGRGDNGVGGVGINWEVALMPLQYKTIADIFAAYAYVYEMRRRYNTTNGATGAFVVVTNASWGLSDIVSCNVGDTWNDCYEKLGEVGILTAAGVKNSEIDIDMLGDTPSGCPSDYLISVMNTDRLDIKAGDSAFGQNSVDLAAPGKDIFTTAPNGQYSNNFQGSSAATPHVSGAVALLYSMACEELASEALRNPSETAKQIKAAILNGVDIIPLLEGLNFTSGRLNLYNSMLEVQQQCNPTPGENLSVYDISPNPASDRISVSYEAKGFDPIQVRIYDVVGRLIYEEERVPCCQIINRFSLEIDKYAVGAYFLQIEQNEEYVSSRFIKY